MASRVRWLFFHSILPTKHSQYHTAIRVDLTTGGVLVGEGLDTPASGISVSGVASTDKSRDTVQWVATTGFNLQAPGATESYGRVDEVIHRHAPNIKGVRVSASGPRRFLYSIHPPARNNLSHFPLHGHTSVVPDKAFVITPQGELYLFVIELRV